MNKIVSLPVKLGVILAIKLIALLGIYWLFFGPMHRVKIDSTQVQSRFYSGDVDNSSGDK